MTRITRSLAAAAVAAGLATVAVVPGASAADSPEPVVCNGTIENTVVGDVTVPYRASCTLRNVVVHGSVTARLNSRVVALSDVVVTGGVAAESWRLEVRRSVVLAGISSMDAAQGVLVARTVVGGGGSFVNTEQGITLGGADGDGNVFGGDVAVTQPFGDGLIGANVVGGDLVVRDATAALVVRRNVVRGALDCAGGLLDPTGGANVAGVKRGQCAAL